MLLIGTALAGAQAPAPSPGERGTIRRPPERTGTFAPRTRARESRSSEDSERKADVPESGLRFLSSEMSFSGKVVKRLPYSAETITENTRTLGNGTKLTQRTTGTVYRDDEGRTRREMSASTAGPFATSGDTQRLIFINDPVAGISSTIMPDSDTAVTKPLPANNEEPPESEVSSENSRTDSLGKDVIEGFVAEGTRTTISIPAGTIGNDQPLEIVHERWYSPELQTILRSKHSDPRWGETVYELRNIDRGAPASSLFALPANSTLNGKKTRPRQ
jgi:hypothetical protein